MRLKPRCSGVGAGILAAITAAGWGAAAGQAPSEDVRLESVSMENVKPAVVIDAGRTGEPISKYIYGQFIEHLGRCIYGGIWAEMLEDRKFFYAVGSPESPWRAVGEDDVVEMDKAGTFVGEHTPRVRVSTNGPTGGIVHGGLGLQKGRAYAGRVVLAGDPAAGPVSVSLVWGADHQDRETVAVGPLTPGFAAHPLRFTAGGNTDDGRLEIVGTRPGVFGIGAVSLMPADNVHGMRADTLKVLKELDAPVYRWPGGNFVSGYDWKDGIGERDRRPPRKNPAWKGVEHNDFGLDEFMAFSRS